MSGRNKGDLDRWDCRGDDRRRLPQLELEQTILVALMDLARTPGKCGGEHEEYDKDDQAQQGDRTPGRLGIAASSLVG